MHKANPAIKIIESILVNPSSKQRHLINLATQSISYVSNALDKEIKYVKIINEGENKERKKNHTVPHPEYRAELV